MTTTSTVNINQACALVKVTRRTIYNWIALGKIDYKRTAGGHIRILTESLWQSSTDTKAAA